MIFKSINIILFSNLLVVPILNPYLVLPVCFNLFNTYMNTQLYSWNLEQYFFTYSPKNIEPRFILKRKIYHIFTFKNNLNKPLLKLSPFNLYTIAPFTFNYILNLKNQFVFPICIFNLRIQLLIFLSLISHFYFQFQAWKWKF